MMRLCCQIGPKQSRTVAWAALCCTTPPSRQLLSPPSNGLWLGGMANGRGHRATTFFSIVEPKTEVEINKMRHGRHVVVMIDSKELTEKGIALFRRARQHSHHSCFCGSHRLHLHICSSVGFFQGSRSEDF